MLIYRNLNIVQMYLTSRLLVLTTLLVVLLNAAVTSAKIAAKPDYNNNDDSPLVMRSVSNDLFKNHNEESATNDSSLMRKAKKRIGKFDLSDLSEKDSSEKKNLGDDLESDEDETVDFVIEPITLSRNEELIQYNKEKEYILVHKELRWADADNYCQRMLHGSLAQMDDELEAKFVARGLAESNLHFDVSFIGAKRDKFNLNNWYWFDVGVNSSMVDEILLEDYMVIRQNDKDAKQRQCLAFSRKNIYDPFFVDLECDIERTFICQRKPHNNKTEDQYYRKWLTVADGLYSIFPEELTRESARLKCRQFDEEATLAIVPTTTVANILGQYLLIGRPSLEKAWTDGLYDDVMGWIFESTEKRIPTIQLVESDGIIYPPWKNNKPNKNGGCILLNRQHGSNNTVFVNTRCGRLSPYICYKPRTDVLSNNRVDFKNINGINYRLYFSQVPWETAKKVCEGDKGILAEPLNGEQDLKDYIYMMGETRMEIQHMWLGGKFEKTKWLYASSDREIKGLNTTNWFKNVTYIDHIERGNTCLNIDREYHLIPVLYGTSCLYPQYFLCQLGSE